MDYSISLKFSRSRGETSRSQRDKTCAKILQIINNSAGDCSISLKFCTDFWSRDAWYTVILQGQRIKLQGHSVTKYQHLTNAIIQARISCRRSNLVKIIPEPSATLKTCSSYKVKHWNRNNAAADCSIAFKFGTEFHHVTGNTLQMFKFKGQRSRSQGQRSRSHRKVMYQQQKAILSILYIMFNYISWKGNE